MLKLEFPKDHQYFFILFQIYINRICEQIKKKLLGIILLLFIDDLKVTILGVLVKKMVKTLEKVRKIVLKQGEKNAMTQDTTKTELVLFFY